MLVVVDHELVHEIQTYHVGEWFIKTSSPWSITRGVAPVLAHNGFDGHSIEFIHDALDEERCRLWCLGSRGQRDIR